MKKVCPVCLHIFDNAPIDYCPLNDCCSAELVDLDDMLVDVMIELWDIGISTRYCCAGHLYTDHFRAYVMFDDNCGDEFPCNFEEFRTLFFEVASKRESKDIKIEIDNIGDKRTLTISCGGETSVDKKGALAKQNEFILFLYDVVEQFQRTYL